MSMSAQQERFILWLLRPKHDRDPRTQKALAEEMGVAEYTLSEWKRDTDFLEAWNNRYLRTISSPETKMTIMQTLLGTASDADDPKHVQAAKAYFEIEGSLRPAKNQVDVKVTQERTSDLSDEELEKLLAERTEDELAKRREAK